MGARQRQKLLKRRKAVAHAARAKARTRSVALGGTLITAAAATLAGAAPAHAGPVDVTPRVVSDILPGADNSSVEQVTAVGGTTFFVATNNSNGERELWMSDGTAAGTRQVADINATGASYPTNLTAVGDRLYFTADDGVHGRELWRTDGTEAGTALVEDIAPGLASGVQNLNRPFPVLDGAVYFNAYQPDTGTELWTSDGTVDGTTIVKDLVPGTGWGTNYYAAGVAVGDTLYFTGYQSTTGHELWKTDGTEAGTALVKDIRPGADSSRWYYDDAMVNVGGTLFLVADDGTHGRELWSSDGTDAGTTLVKDVAPGPASGVNPGWWYSGYGNMTAASGSLYFVGQDEDAGPELWTSDGTETGTTRVVDVNPGRDGSEPREITAVGDSVYFSAYNRVSGRELWKVEGGSAQLVRDIAPGSFNASPYDLTASGGRLWFNADDGLHGRELWSSDGTTANTAIAADLYAGVDGSDPSALTDVAGRLFFGAYTEDTGRELWTVDVAPATPPTTTTPTTPTTTPTAPPLLDTAVTGAVVKLKSPQKQRKNVRVRVRTSASEAVTAHVTGTITITGRKKPVMFAPAMATTTGEQDAVALTLRVGTKASKKVLRAVERFRDATAKDKKKLAVKAKVTVLLIDQAGNKIIRNVVVKLV